jgi:hypothetical protein
MVARATTEPRAEPAALLAVVDRHVLGVLVERAGGGEGVQIL